MSLGLWVYLQFNNSLKAIKQQLLFRLLIYLCSNRMCHKQYGKYAMLHNSGRLP